MKTAIKNLLSIKSEMIYIPKKPMIYMGLFLFAIILIHILTLNDIKAPAVPSRFDLSGNKSSQVTLTPAQEQEIGLQTQVAGEIPFNQQVISNGQVQVPDERQLHVFATAQGKAVQVFVKLGQVVKAGEVLAEIKSDILGDLQDTFLQTYLQNENSIQQAKAQIEFSKANYNREKFLYQKKVSAQIDYEAARTQYLKDVANVNSLRSQQRTLIDTAKRRYALYDVPANEVKKMLMGQKIMPYLKVIAPRGGVIIARNLNSGEMVDPSNEIFTIADIHRVWLSGNVYENDLSKVKKGQPITVTVDSYPDKKFNGTINFVSEVLDPTVRTLEVRGEIDNPDSLLRPNMFARMTIDIGTRNAFAIPSESIQKKGDSNFVYVLVKPHTYEERQVTIGEDNGQYVEILKGLKPNETIATKGTMTLQGKIMKESY